MLPPKTGNSRKIREFIFNQGKSGGKERYFEKSGNIRKVLELLLFHFREVTVSILTHASSWVWQLPSFLLFTVFSSVQSFWSAVPHLMEQKFEDLDITSVKINNENIRGNLGEMSSIEWKISGKIREFCLEITVATLNYADYCINYVICHRNYLYYYINYVKSLLVLQNLTRARKSGNISRHT